MQRPTIFEKIISREIPSHILYEDNSYIAFLSINPRAPGHTLVVPKEWCHFVWDHTDIGAYMQVTQKIALAMRKAFKTDLIRSSIYGEEVPHAHIHVFPDIESSDKSDLLKYSELIKSFL